MKREESKSNSNYDNIQNFSTQVVAPSKAYNFDAINCDFIQTFINPDEFKSQRPNVAPIPTTIASSRVMFQVTTNAAGAAFAYIFPLNPLGNGTAGN